ncbi:DBIRD complex subunit ZNF326-like [Polyodon spathula]|uniref:DBIRD complex subunit ZNF326-like n=1 Tax=Polyodon spathula TaxID=7913 RepID=UPI001B7E955A|nr:DBIRD complex subunit ZNF326-like [Polyodon spathula]
MYSSPEMNRDYSNGTFGGQAPRTIGSYLSSERVTFGGPTERSFGSYGLSEQGNSGGPSQRSFGSYGFSEQGNSGGPSQRSFGSYGFSEQGNSGGPSQRSFGSYDLSDQGNSGGPSQRSFGSYGFSEQGNSGGPSQRSFGSYGFSEQGNLGGLSQRSFGSYGLSDQGNSGGPSQRSFGSYGLSEQGSSGGPSQRLFDTYKSSEQQNSGGATLRKTLHSYDSDQGNAARPTQRFLSSFSLSELENAERFGRSESYRSGSDNGGYGGFDSEYDNSFQNNLDSHGVTRSLSHIDNGKSNLEPSYPGSNSRAGFRDEERGGYSSYSTFSSPHMKPAPVGFRGRSYGLGGPTAFRGRGQMGDFRTPRPGVYQDQMTIRGVKREINAPYRPNTFNKKQKLTKPFVPFIKKPGNSDSGNKEEEKRKLETRLEAKRDKQRRRREKYNYKCGGQRVVYTCSFCKFLTSEEKEIEDHLEGSYHQESLENIRKDANLDEVVIRFLHESIVHKFKRNLKHKLQWLAMDPQQTSVQTQKHVMEAVTEDDYMRRATMIHCIACDTYIPATKLSAQDHLKSTIHLTKKVEYKEQLKRERVLMATSLLNNPTVKERYERFVKGENPFEITEDDAEMKAQNDDAELNHQTDDQAVAETVIEMN